MIATGVEMGENPRIIYVCPACGHKVEVPTPEAVAIAFMRGILAQLKDREEA
jgi:uncharacterized protein YlaI